jgi:hypothetical protein
MAADLVTPEELRRIADEIEMAKARQALEKKKKQDSERAAFHDTFVHEELRPDVMQRVSALVRGAAERGEHEVLAMRFPSEYCTDGGRAINNLEPGWPQTLSGVAMRGYEFWEQELAPKGYKVRAQILSFPDGMPGDVGVFLRW